MVRQITPKEVAMSLANGHVVHLLDVRQPEEHAICSLPNAVLIPLNELPQRSEEFPFSQNATVIVYCHHGMRSLHGAAFLEQMGFTNVASLQGGIDAWALQVDPETPRY